MSKISGVFLLGSCPSNNVSLLISSSKPVAITVTITSSWRFSFLIAPKIILTSLFAASLTVSTASSISNNVRFLPPVTLTIAFVALQ